MDEKNFKFMIYIIVAVVAGIIAGSLVTGLISQNLSNGGGTSISMLPPVSASSEWLVKIDKYVITKKDFDEFYRLYIAQIPANQLTSVPDSMLRKNFLDNLIGTYIINLRAISDGTIDKSMATAALRQAIFSIYMNKYAPQDKSIFVPTADEINAFYEQHRAQIDPRMSADQITQYLKQYLSEQNYQKWAADFINASKGSYKIETNQAVIREEGISESQATGSANQGGGYSPVQQPPLAVSNR